MDKTLERALIDTVRVIEKKGIQYALIGGLAASIRGKMRATEDVDIVLHCDVLDALSLAESIDDTPLEPLFPNVSEVIRRSNILPLRHKQTGVTIDLAIGLSGFERQVIERATSVKIARRHLQVSTAEDLLLMKLLADRPQDQQDIKGILTAQRNQIDWEYCRAVGQQLQDALGIDFVRQINDFQKHSRK